MLIIVTIHTKNSIYIKFSRQPRLSQFHEGTGQRALCNKFSNFERWLLS